MTDIFDRARERGIEALDLGPGCGIHLTGYLEVKYFPVDGSAYLYDTKMRLGGTFSGDQALDIAAGLLPTIVPNKREWKAWNKRKRLKRRFLKLDPRCTYCRKLTTPETATLDHLIPISKGGRTILENVVLSCRDCNVKKGNKVRDELPHGRTQREIPGSALASEEGRE